MSACVRIRKSSSVPARMRCRSRSRLVIGATAATDASCDTADAAMNCSQVIPEIFRCTVVYGAKITSS